MTRPRSAPSAFSASSASPSCTSGISRISRMSRAVVAIALAAFAAACGETKKPPPPTPPAVLVTPVTRQDVPIFVEAVGTLDGYVNADIRARVKGYLRSQDYKDGSTVKEGQLLFTIEQAEYTTAVAAARAAAARA